MLSKLHVCTYIRLLVRVDVLNILFSIITVYYCPSGRFVLFLCLKYKSIYITNKKKQHH